MRRRIIILIFAVIMAFAGIAVHLFGNYNNQNIYFVTVPDEGYLKNLSITLESTNIVPKVDKRKIRNVASKMLREASIKPKEVYIEYGLITDKGTSINVLSKDVLKANPALKEKASISQIPVWLITFKELQPEENKSSYDSPNNNLPGKRPLDVTTTVIDAMSGKVLYGFGTWK